MNRRFTGGFIAGFLTAAAAAWLAGFLWFVRGALATPETPPYADGIVALTGGADQIAAALDLLRQNRAPILLISGVGPNIALGELLKGTRINPASLAGRVTLGHAATDTLGNADEAAAWAEQNHLHSLIVVTATYHMQRALTEMRRSLPEVTLYAAPVLPPALRGQGRLSTLRLLADEYTKFLMSELGLTRLHHGWDSG